MALRAAASMVRARGPRRIFLGLSRLPVQHPSTRSSVATPGRATGRSSRPGPRGNGPGPQPPIGIDLTYGPATAAGYRRVPAGADYRPLSTRAATRPAGSAMALVAAPRLL